MIEQGVWISGFPGIKLDVWPDDAAQFGMKINDNGAGIVDN